MWETTSADKNQIARLHESYLGSLPLSQKRLKNRFEEGLGVVLDSSIESLVPLFRWFVKHLHEIVDVPVSTLPSWWNPHTPTADAGDPKRYPFTRLQLELIDEVQAYMAEVMQAVRPDAKWVIYKHGKYDINNGLSMLDLGKKQFLSTRVVVYTVALGTVFYDQTDPDDALASIVRKYSV